MAYILLAPPEPAVGCVILPPFLYFWYPKVKSDKLTSSDPVRWKLLFHNRYY